MRAVILAAGCGERLLPLTKNYPKPLTPVLGKPLLEHIVETAKEAMVTDIVIVTGYLNHFIQEYFGDGSKLYIEARIYIMREIRWTIFDSDLDDEP